MEMKIVGKRIRDRRKELQLLQTDIQAKCGISSGALSEIENGNRIPTISTFFQLAEILDCSMDWLITGKAVHGGADLISENEEKLLNGFRLLQKEEQEELMEILNLKLKKAGK